LVEVPTRLLERALGVHDPRLGRLAKLFHHRRRDLGHDSFSVSTSGSGSGSGAAPSPLGVSSSGTAASGSAAGRRAISPAATFCLPASIPSAIALITSPHERIASSLPG